jgi:hypothetical protein
MKIKLTFILVLWQSIAQTAQIDSILRARQAFNNSPYLSWSINNEALQNFNNNISS